MTNLGNGLEVLGDLLRIHTSSECSGVDLEQIRQHEHAQTIRLIRSDCLGCDPTSFVEVKIRKLTELALLQDGLRFRGTNTRQTHSSQDLIVPHGSQLNRQVHRETHGVGIGSILLHVLRGQGDHIRQVPAVCVIVQLLRKGVVVVVQSDTLEESSEPTDHIADTIHVGTVQLLRLPSQQSSTIRATDGQGKLLTIPLLEHRDRRNHITNPMYADRRTFPQMQSIIQFRRQNRDVIISNSIQEHRLIQFHLDRTESLPSSIQEDSLDLTLCSSRIELHCDLILVGTIVPSDLSLEFFIRQGDYHTIDGKSQGRTNHAKLTVVSLDLQHQSQIVTLDDFSGDQQIQFIRHLTEVLDILHVLQIGSR